MVTTVIPIQSLRDDPDAVLRQVQDDGVTIEVVDLGRIVARIVPAAPADPEAVKRATAEALAEMDRVANAIAARMKDRPPPTGSDLEFRRDP